MTDPTQDPVIQHAAAVRGVTVAEFMAIAAREAAASIPRHTKPAPRGQAPKAPGPVPTADQVEALIEELRSRAARQMSFDANAERLVADSADIDLKDLRRFVRNDLALDNDQLARLADAVGPHPLGENLERLPRPIRGMGGETRRAERIRLTRFRPTEFLEPDPVPVTMTKREEAEALAGAADRCAVQAKTLYPAYHGDVVAILATQIESAAKAALGNRASHAIAAARRAGWLAPLHPDDLMEKFGINARNSAYYRYRIGGTNDQ